MMHEYEILEHAVLNVKETVGLVCEIGIAGGDSTKIIFNGLRGSNKTYVGIDPYGDIPYMWRENTIAPFTYGNSGRDDVMINLYQNAKETSVNFLYLPLESEEFFYRFSDGVPIYQNGAKKIVNTYALVFLDGRHDYKSVLGEVNFFLSRMPVGAWFVFDDVDGYYDHNKIETTIFGMGFELVTKGKQKASYIRKYPPTIPARFDV